MINVTAVQSTRMAKMSVFVRQCVTVVRKMFFLKNFMSKEAAIIEIRQNAGTQFDPVLSDIFIEKVLSDEEGQ